MPAYMHVYMYANGVLDFLMYPRAIISRLRCMVHISTCTLTCTTYLLNAVHMYMYICTVQYRTVPYGTVLYMYYGTVRYSTSELNLVHVRVN